MTPTDAMIEAGDQVLGEYWALKCAARQGAVRRIWLAMESARDPDDLREALEDAKAVLSGKMLGPECMVAASKAWAILYHALSRNRGDVGHG